MKLIPTGFEGAFIVEFQSSVDERGSFVKVFNNAEFAAAGIQTEFKESYYSVSKKGVIRGMHFQIPPFDHYKLVYVTDGVVLDVILDIRKKSKTFGKFFSTEISSLNKKGSYMTSGFAHGFTALSKQATMVYNVSTVYNSKYDTGILWNSFGFSWGIKNPIVSERDKSFQKFNEFKSPF